MSWDIQGQPTVSIVIPNRNAAAVLKQCVTGLLEGTSYPRRELVIVDNGSTESEVLELYRSIERDGHGHRGPFDRPFNFSAACNAGAAVARGELLLFLNNDIEVIHAGLARGAGTLGSTAGRRHRRGEALLSGSNDSARRRRLRARPGRPHLLASARRRRPVCSGPASRYRNYLAVTGACQMMRRDVFRQLGGFDERFRLSFSDVVLCMEAWTAGYRVVYTPYARLVHHESYTRKREDSAEDMELLARYLQRHAASSRIRTVHPELESEVSRFRRCVRRSIRRRGRSSATTSIACLAAGDAESCRRW